MSTFWPDDLVDQVIATLQAAAPTSGIAGFSASKILDGDMLPSDLTDLPVVGVYIPEEKAEPSNPETDSGGNQQRVATIRVEIRAAVTPATADANGTSIRGVTKALRKWVLAVLMKDQQLNGRSLLLHFSSTTFWGRSSEKRMGGADLDFEASYLFNAEN